MSGGTGFKLAVLALVLLAAQAAWYLRLPDLRAGMDLYVVFLLLVTALYGPLAGGIFAMAGGLLMDAPGAQLQNLHLLYYLLPVLLGALLRSAMVLEYRLVGALVAGLLLLAKIGLPWLALRLAGAATADQLRQLNYWPLLVLWLLLLISWRWLVRVLKPQTRVARLGN